jgi:hypothetical protein
VPEAAAPGTVAAGTPPHADDLRRGNVVVLASRADVGPATALARDVAGPPDEALRAAGQAIIVERSNRRAGVAAYAEGRAITVSSASDPQLRAFLEYWLGRSAG